MLDQSTLRIVHETLGFEALINVCQLDTIICTKKVKKQHLGDASLFVRECLRKLGNEAVTEVTSLVMCACIEYEQDLDIAKVATEFEPMTLVERIDSYLKIREPAPITMLSYALLPKMPKPFNPNAPVLRWTVKFGSSEAPIYHSDPQV